jgi:hypothetical protein
VVDSSTQATATFDLGTPVGTGSPLLSFKKEAVVHFSASPSSLTQALAVSSSSSGLQCSFAGGCNYEVSSVGLSSILKGDSAINYLTVCDEKCVFNEKESTSTSAKCKMPKLSTVYSNQNYNVSTESENLKSGKYFGTAQDYEIAFDNDLLVTPTDASAPCHFGMQFKEGHVGLLS